MTGGWLITVSRRLTNHDGSFAGVTGAVLDQSYFSAIYRSLRVGTKGVVAVLHRDGMMLVREPVVSDVFTRRYGGSALINDHLPQSDAGAYEGHGLYQSGPRIMGYRAVSGLPLVVAVTYDRASVLEAWYRHLYIFGSLTALMVLVVAVGAIRLMRQTRNLADKTGILEVTLENVAHGLCMFDAAQRLILSNRRYAEMYGLTPELTVPGTTFRRILEAWGTTDRITAGSGVDQRIADAARNEPFDAVNRLPNGRVIAVTHQPILDGGWVAIHQDVTDRLRDEEKVTFMARHDLLTGIANRTSFMEKLEANAAGLRQHQAPFSVFMLDLDHFKNVNDSFGHPAGDALLKEITIRLRSMLRDTDVIARLGGDEFAIIQVGEKNQRAAAMAIAERIIDLLTEPFEINGKMVSIGASMGIALAPANGCEPDALIKKADLALYRTKQDGRNGYRFFDEHMTAEAEARYQMESDLRAALAADALEVHYQPILDVRTRKLFGVEALARWRHPVKGDISPAEFIPLAEETGLIDRLGQWVLHKACSDAMKWPADIKVAVNISPLQVRKSNLFDIVLCVLADTGMPPHRLELEITETTLLENEPSHLAAMHQLKKLGVAISLDDFGTGYSSMSYLTMFPFDKIKIDRSFTRNMPHRTDCAAIVSSVLALAAGLDLPTVAEGVETEQQFDMLQKSGVQYVQGFLFGRPCRASELPFGRQWDWPRFENVA